MSFQTINPATGEIVRTLPTTSDEEVATALKTVTPHAFVPADGKTRHRCGYAYVGQYT
jgi:acyl-CoA reductase-like NAD-dependent aldehyde dehydrogenase